MAKVSVIVPVYNVEKYIERCARSLFEQTLEDMEFVFIDDCTPDNSMGVLAGVINDYPQRKQQVVQYRMPENSGLAKVRKKGYEIAKGDYVIACDSDDYVDVKMYETMYNYATQNKLDIVHCDIDIVDDDQIIQTLTINGTTSPDGLKKGMIEGSISNSLCNKLLNRSIFSVNEIQYAEAAMDEDNTLAVQFAYYAKKIGYIKQSFYKAYQNPQSVSRLPGEQQTLAKYNGSLKNSIIMIDFLKSHGFKDTDLAVINAKLRPKMTLCPALGNHTIVKKWMDTYPETNRQVFYNKAISLRVKIKCALIILYLFPSAKKMVKILR